MRYLFTFIFFFIILNAYTQQNYTMSGYVSDKQTGEVLIGAVVADSTMKYATTTNGYGFFSLTIPAGEYTFFCSFLGYNNNSINILHNKNILMNFELSSSFLQLEQVNIVAKYENDPNKQNEFNTEKLNIQNIKLLPSIFGEADVIKAVQSMSGVKTIGDGSSAMFIRGGGSDQNLILIDEAPVYNPSHLFGLVSVFNPDALNSITICKSNTSAQYGGRVSGVIDCKMKEGNTKEYRFSTGISTLSSIFTIEGPMIKEKISFLFSARKSWVDIFFKPGKALDIVPGFYDINLKTNAKINKKNKIYFSIYQGQDVIQSSNGFFNKWGNKTATLRWNNNFGSRLFSNMSVIYSDYQNYLEFSDNDRNFKWLTGINDISIKEDISYYVNPNNLIKFGVGSIYHRFIPGESEDAQQNIERIQAWEHSVYILNDVKVAKWFGINYGLRLSAFQNIGKAHLYSFDENYNLAGEIVNSKGIFNTYWTPEPRVNINFKINPDYSLKVSYSRNAQYMQVLQNNSLSYTSLETWFPATVNVKPILTNTYLIGWFQDISNKYFISIESYFKNVKNQIDYVDHTNIINNPYIEGNLRNGKAYSYGIEMNLKMEFNNFNCSLGYTYSRSFRKIDGINNSKIYSAPFDIPHDIRIAGNYKLTKKINISSTWIFMTGRPLTLPVGFFYVNNEPIPIYSDRNSSRFPNYHRLDIALNYSNRDMERKTYWECGIGVFNVYARKNPIGYEFRRQGGVSTSVDIYQYILFTLMPNFSVKINF